MDEDGSDLRFFEIGKETVESKVLIDFIRGTTEMERSIEGREDDRV